jgi:hypothetical protein
MYRARDSRCNRLVDRDGTSAAVSGGVLEAVVDVSLSLTVTSFASVSFLVATDKLFLVLHFAISHFLTVSMLFDLALSVVWRTTAATVGVLTVHSRLDNKV